MPFAHGQGSGLGVQFMPLEAFGMGIQSYIGQFTGQPGCYAAGGPEWVARRQREADGIPLPGGLYAELAAAGAALGIVLEF